MDESPLRNTISDAGAEALADSPFLGPLRQLQMRGNPVTSRGVEALRRRFGEGVQV
jgi:hypothetical protein